MDQKKKRVFRHVQKTVREVSRLGVGGEGMNGENGGLPVRPLAMYYTGMMGNTRETIQLSETTSHARIHLHRITSAAQPDAQCTHCHTRGRVLEPLSLECLNMIILRISMLPSSKRNHRNPCLRRSIYT